MSASVFNPNWKYVNAQSTDIRQTFARVRKEQQAEREAAKKITHLPRQQTKGKA